MNNVNDRIKAICRRVGIEHKSAHVCGRVTRKYGDRYGYRREDRHAWRRMAAAAFSLLTKFNSSGFPGDQKKLSRARNKYGARAFPVQTEANL